GSAGDGSVGTDVGDRVGVLVPERTCRFPTLVSVVQHAHREASHLRGNGRAASQAARPGRLGNARLLGRAIVVGRAPTNAAHALTRFAVAGNAAAVTVVDGIDEGE